MSEYSEFTKSLKRLYDNQRISLEQIKKMLRLKKISGADYEFIIRKE